MTHRSQALLTLLTALTLGASLGASYAASPSASGSPLPALGAPDELPLGVERRAGEQVARALYRDSDYIDDPLLQSYVEDIYKKIIDAGVRRGDIPADLYERFGWRVFVGRDRQVNAFALPGGYFGMQLGLVGVTQTPHELASVVAHEITHVAQRHISRQVAREKQIQPLVLAATLLGLVAARGSADAANAAVAIPQAAGISQQLSFSRDMEREADRIGLSMLAAAGYDPAGMTAMFERLFASARLTDSGAFPYLRSHPLTVDRIAEARDALGLSGVGLVGQSPSVAANAPTLQHSLMVARARMLSVPIGQAWKQAIAAADGAGFASLSREAQAVAAYSALVAGTLSRDFEAARRQIARLQTAISDAPEWRSVVVPSLLELAIAAQDTSLAQAHTSALASSAGLGQRAQVLNTVRWQLLQGGPANTQAAVERLQTWVASEPNDAQAWTLLAAALEARGQRVRAVEAQAQAKLAQHDAAGALDRLRAAQDLMRQERVDEVQAAIIDTKVLALRLRLREEAVQSRLDR